MAGTRSGFRRSMTWGFGIFSLVAPVRSQGNGLDYETKLKVETEFRIPLTKEGYNHMLKEWDFKDTSYREDTYIEVFDGQNFLLREGALPVKARFMQSAKKMQWQVTESRRVEFFRSTSFNVSLKETERRTLIESDYPDLGPVHESMKKDFDDLDQDVWGRHRLDKTSEELQELPPITEMIRLVAPRKIQGGWLLPAEVAKKSRHVDVLEIEGLEVELILGKNQSRAPDGSPYEEYEIEADVEAPLSSAVRQAFQILARRLEQSGLRSEHVDTIDIDRFAFARSAYEQAAESP